MNLISFDLKNFIIRDVTARALFYFLNSDKNPNPDSENAEVKMIFTGRFCPHQFRQKLAHQYFHPALPSSSIICHTVTERTTTHKNLSGRDHLRINLCVSEGFCTQLSTALGLLSRFPIFWKLIGVSIF